MRVISVTTSPVSLQFSRLDALTKKPSRTLVLNPTRQVCGFLYSWVCFLSVVFLSLLSTFAFYCLTTLDSWGGGEVLIKTEEKTFDIRSF